MRSSRAGGEFLCRLWDAVVRVLECHQTWGLQSARGRKFRGKGEGAAGDGGDGRVGRGGGSAGALWWLERLPFDSLGFSACTHLFPPPASLSARRSPLHQQTSMLAAFLLTLTYVSRAALTLCCEVLWIL